MALPPLIDWRDVFVPVERLEPGVAARLIRQRVGLRIGAQRWRRSMMRPARNGWRCRRNRPSSGPGFRRSSGELDTEHVHSRPVLLFSSTVLATDTLPTSHPARVNGAQGAGAILPNSFTISGAPSGMMLVQ